MLLLVSLRAALRLSARCHQASELRLDDLPVLPFEPNAVDLNLSCFHGDSLNNGQLFRREMRRPLTGAKEWV